MKVVEIKVFVHVVEGTCIKVLFTNIQVVCTHPQLKKCSYVYVKVVEIKVRICTCGGRDLCCLMEISSFSSSLTLFLSFLITALSSNSSLRLREGERERERDVCV